MKGYELVLCCVNTLKNINAVPSGLPLLTAIEPYWINAQNQDTRVWFKNFNNGHSSQQIAGSVLL